MNDNRWLTEEELKMFLDATIQLTELRQNECKHLCVENAAAEIFRNLITEYQNYGRERIYLDASGDLIKPNN